MKLDTSWGHRYLGSYWYLQESFKYPAQKFGSGAKGIAVLNRGRAAAKVKAQAYVKRLRTAGYKARVLHGDVSWDIWAKEK